MTPIVFDCECFYDPPSGYTLSKMTTEAFVRDPRFSLHGAALKIGDRPAVWYPTDTLVRVMAEIDWSQVFCISHHAHWDHFVLNHHFGIRPAKSGCTLSMARLMLGNHISVSLDSVRAHFGIPAKTTPYNLFVGKHWDQMDPLTQRLLGEGACDEAESKWVIFRKMLADGFPLEELEVISMTVKMFSEPQLLGDTAILAQVWKEESERKKELLKSLEVTAEDLQSADKFAALLNALGIEPEMKQGKNGLIYAFAATDDFMKDYLLVHEDDDVRLLAEARIVVKSNGAQTRAERLGWMATRGPMPVYLNYCGARTTRWSGGDKVNWQNFKRGSLIRKAMKAPAQHKVVKADLAQIECRVLNYLAEQWDVIERFKNQEDPYVGIASRFYGRSITKNNPAERGVGKQLELSCGYGSGGPTIVRTAKRGTYGPPVQLTEQQGMDARDLYRSTHPQVVDYWKQASRMISAIGGTNHEIEWGPLLVDTQVIRCQGLPVWYPEMHYHRDEETGEGNWRYKSRKGLDKIYGGKLTQNICELVARLIASQSLLCILTRTNIRPAQLEHDAAVWCCPNDLLTPFVTVVQEEMTRAPVWLPGIPLACEITTGETM